MKISGSTDNRFNDEQIRFKSHMSLQVNATAYVGLLKYIPKIQCV